MCSERNQKGLDHSLKCQLKVRRFFFGAGDSLAGTVGLIFTVFFLLILGSSEENAEGLSKLFPNVLKMKAVFLNLHICKRVAGMFFQLFI
jgi:hypothetical protein